MVLAVCHIKLTLKKKIAFLFQADFFCVPVKSLMWNRASGSKVLLVAYIVKWCVASREMRGWCRKALEATFQKEIEHNSVNWM